MLQIKRLTGLRERGESVSQFSERDVCTKHVLPALAAAGWDVRLQIREEVPLTDGKLIVSGSGATRAKRKRADYVLYLKPNLPLAVIEVKGESHPVGSGLQQALEYAEMLNVPFAFSTNGQAYLAHDKTQEAGDLERILSPSEFPSPDDLWKRYQLWRHLPIDALPLLMQDYHSDASERSPRYYQATAINRAVPRSRGVAENERARGGDPRQRAQGWPVRGAGCRSARAGYRSSSTAATLALPTCPRRSRTHPGSSSPSLPRPSWVPCGPLWRKGSCSLDGTVPEAGWYALRFGVVHPRGARQVRVDLADVLTSIVTSQSAPRTIARDPSRRTDVP